jgi:hypothetical protein
MNDLRPDDIRYLQSIPAAVTAQGMKDLDDIVRLLIVALLSGGHVLLEGNPGLGKTALIKALSNALGLGDAAVGRIQFTPDLMPADITGTLMPSDEDGARLVFRKGPIFHELLLADEINRATPKTQSAMLEAMAEHQVTVLGERRYLRSRGAGGGRPNGDNALHGHGHPEPDRPGRDLQPARSAVGPIHVQGPHADAAGRDDRTDHRQGTAAEHRQPPPGTLCQSPRRARQHRPSGAGDPVRPAAAVSPGAHHQHRDGKQWRGR